MKKWIAFVIAFVLLFSVACADSMDEFMEAWNKAAHIYGAPEMTMENAYTGEGAFAFFTDDYGVKVELENDEIVRAAVIARDGDTFLPLAVMLGVTVVKNKSAETLQRFLGNVLTLYLRMISDQSTRHSSFDCYEFHMEKSEQGFLMMRMELQ